MLRLTDRVHDHVAQPLGLGVFCTAVVGRSREIDDDARPRKAGLDKDFPNLLEKPVDTPYGPYADGFSEQQHKYGPFAPIRAALARLKAEKERPAPR